jgi:hypothetical protein
MPWYYAGPEAKPLGPVSAEQLQALHAGGTITSETFVIEHTGAAGANLAWRRYREAFPTAATLPPIPHPTTFPGSVSAPPAPHAPAPGTVAAPNPSAPGSVSPHPLFPSAAPAAYPPAYGIPAHSGAYPPIRPTNSWCAWGFALSLLGFCFAFLCIGIVPALIAAVLCIIGLVQVSKSHSEGGQGLAITGLIFSGVALLIAILIISWFSPSILKAHGLTVTEQTSNDSE